MRHLACIRGVIGYWIYYSTVMKIKDIVENNTIITVPESEELFAHTINEILQREVNSKRTKQISNYISNNQERFFSNLIVAFHKGEPKWTEVEISNNFEVDNTLIDSDSISFLSNKFGVLTLTGDEEMFALDGQHRLLGLRAAYSENPAIGDLEVGITFVIHKNEFLEKTRRLFTVLNKYAEKPKGAELIILDEDDAAAINSRKLVTEHPILSIPNALSNSKLGGLTNNDLTSFTTLVTINKINKILYLGIDIDYNTRPSDEILQDLYTLSTNFWNLIFETFPELIQFINGEENILINDIAINRDNETGGSLLLRPTGQELLAIAYTKFNLEEREILINKLRLIDFDLSSENWKYIYWNEKMLGKEAKLKNDLILFLLGKNVNAVNIHNNMNRVYQSYGQDYHNHISQIEI
ncbi:DGQHR domain-containing protein [Flavobacterium sp. LB3P45]|uniref:DGQHR domain-containing protein n=1 Tax=Flavobacterium fructosi TaxID=3230416 RepID=A0ABW6HQF9_9FLAO